MTAQFTFWNFTLICGQIEQLQTLIYLINIATNERIYGILSSEHMDGRFPGSILLEVQVPKATPPLKFRNLRQRHRVCEALFWDIV